MNEEYASTAHTIALLVKLKTGMPHFGDRILVVGKWVWHDFTVPIAGTVRSPTARYVISMASAMQLNDTPPKSSPRPSREYKVVALRECPLPEDLQVCDTPQKAAEYWRLHVATIPYFNPECECFAVLMLNTRRRVKGHQLISIGTLDTILVHAREVFRAAIIVSAAAIVIMHNHPSGEPTPSDADIKVTRDLIRAGQLLKLEVLDHVIMGQERHVSLRELGYFA